MASCSTFSNDPEDVNDVLKELQMDAEELASIFEEDFDISEGPEPEKPPLTVTFKSVKEFGTHDRELEAAFAKDDYVTTVLELPHAEKDKWDRAIKKYASKRFAKFFVGDLQDATLNSDKLYVLKKQTFKIVDVVGTITRYVKRDYNHIFDVDDGTGKISCIMRKNIYVDKLTESVKKQTADMIEKKNETGDDTGILTASLMMLGQAKLLLKKRPTFNELKEKRRVRVIGKLAEFNGLKCIFVNDIKKKSYESEQEDMKYLKECYEMYERTKL